MTEEPPKYVRVGQVCQEYQEDGLRYLVVWLTSDEYAPADDEWDDVAVYIEVVDGEPTIHD